MPGPARLKIEGMKGTFLFADIAKMSEHNLSREVVYERWKRNGSQDPISSAVLVLMLEARNASGYGARVPRYKYEGQSVTVTELAKILDTSVTTVRKIIRERGPNLTEKDIRISRMHQKGQEEVKEMKMETKKIEETVEVGSWEREHLSHVGKNGFTGGRSERVIAGRGW